MRARSAADLITWFPAATGQSRIDAGKYEGFRVVRITPADAGLTLDVSRLADAVTRAMVREGRANLHVYPYVDLPKMREQRLRVGIAFGGVDQGQHLNISRFAYQGEIVTVDSMWEDTDAAAGTIDLHLTATMIFGACLFACRYYSLLGYTGQIALSYSQESALDRQLVAKRGAVPDSVWGPLPAAQYPVTVEATFSPDIALDGIGEVAAGLLEQFCWPFHCDLDKQRRLAMLDGLVKEREIVIPDDLIARSGPRTPEGMLIVGEPPRGSPESSRVPPTASPARTRRKRQTVQNVQRKGGTPGANEQVVTEYQYDAYISYSHLDCGWVEGTLLPTLKNADLRPFNYDEDSRPGAKVKRENEDVMRSSRKILLAVTPQYLKSDWCTEERVFAQSLDPEAHDHRVIPLLVQRCKLPDDVKQLRYIDFTNRQVEDKRWQQLLKALKPPEAHELTPGPQTPPAAQAAIPSPQPHEPAIEPQGLPPVQPTAPAMPSGTEPPPSPPPVIPRLAWVFVGLMGYIIGLAAAVCFRKPFLAYLIVFVGVLAGIIEKFVFKPDIPSLAYDPLLRQLAVNRRWQGFAVVAALAMSLMAGVVYRPELQAVAGFAHTLRPPAATPTSATVLAVRTPTAVATATTTAASTLPVSTIATLAATATPVRGIVTAYTYVLAGPDANATIVGFLGSGSVVEVSARQGDWARVKTDAGLGWIRADTIISPAITPSSVTPVRDQGTTPSHTGTPALVPTAMPSHTPTASATAASTPTASTTASHTATMLPSATAISTPTYIIARVPSTPVLPLVGSNMVRVPAGEFLMGSADNDTEALYNEKPQHRVYLDEFWIDQTEVTNGQYRKCVETGLCVAPYRLDSQTRSSYYGNAEYDNYPVIQMIWEDANAYCAWAGKRLPTEAEWEKAARGTDGRQYPWGDLWDASKANAKNSNSDTVPVGSYPSGASPYGALDMAGNVWEWTADWYSDAYYQSAPPRNPLGPSVGDYRVVRGGGFYYVQRNARTAMRARQPLNLYFWDIGFRCVKGSAP